LLLFSLYIFSTDFGSIVSRCIIVYHILSIFDHVFNASDY